MSASVNSDFNSTIVPCNYSPNGIDASQENPCPICDKPDWCRWLSGSFDAIICNREGQPPEGWIQISKDRNGMPIFAKEGSRKRSQRFQLPYPEEIFPLPLHPENDSPQWTTLSTIGKESEQQIEYLYPNPETGEPLGKVVRKQWTDRRKVYGVKKDSKHMRPHHWAKPSHPDMGDEGWWSDRSKGEKEYGYKWPLYRQNEARDAIASGTKVVFLTAGEQAVETARQLGLTAFCNQGGEGSDSEKIIEFLKSNKPELFVIWPDNDSKGRNSSKKLLKACIDRKIPAIILEPENIWLDIPEKGDIHDVVTKSGMDNLEIVKRLEIEIQRALLQRQNEFDESERKTNKPIKPAGLASELAENYRQKLAWHTGFKLWFHYSAKTLGVWSELTEEDVNRIIVAALESRPEMAGNYGGDFLKSTAYILKAYLAAHEWNETPGLVPLLDGVLELATGKLLPHAPGYRLLWCLPYRWEGRTIGCQPIQDWMLESMKGDRDRVQVWRAYYKAVVTGRVDLQRYLEMIGPAGAGKSTGLSLSVRLVGEENTAVTTLEQLENNRFETAAFFGKRLLLITDSEKYGGKVDTLKAITGQDPIRYERKGVQQTKPYRATCLVMMAANEPIQSSDYTSGLARRRLSLPFTNIVSEDQRRDLEKEFEPYLPGFLKWVLEMPDEEMVALVVRTAKTVPSLARFKNETLVQTNPMAEWLDSCVVVQPTIKTYVGVAKREKSSDIPDAYQFPDRWLYANYCEYSSSVVRNPVSLQRFSNLLEDLCISQLKLTTVSKGRDNKGTYFQGLSIRRRDIEDDRPRPITENSNPLDEPPDGGGGNPNLSPPPSSDGLVMESDGLVTTQSRTSDGSDGGDGLSSSYRKEIKNKISDEKINSVEPEVCKSPSPSSQNPETISGQGFHSSLAPSPLRHQAVTSDGNPSLTKCPSEKEVAAQVLTAKTWSAIVKAIDVVAASNEMTRGEVFKFLLKNQLTKPEDRKHLIDLLANHLWQYPLDEEAYIWLPETCWKLRDKAIASAKEMTEKQPCEF